MTEQLFFIVSDLHLGSDYFHRRDFLSWLDELPEQATLILNGDIIDDPRQTLSPEHLAVLERLVSESHRRLVVWIYGNHDADFELADCGKIHFAHQWEIGKRLLVVHGNDLDDIMSRHGLFKWVFRRIHRLCTLLGWHDMHVAEYAKKWNFLYRVLNERVARHALLAAARLGFEAITCGHTHAVMDLERDGRRYLNTGSWTEKPLHYICVNERGMDLRPYGDAGV
jgi:UDP-2,3-diacylglucosamine pyrophosphatase LpxH